MKKIIYISLVPVIFMFASAGKSFACSCVAGSEPLKTQIQNSFTNAAVIFSGEVVEVKQSPTDEFNFVVRFKVVKSWKGESRAEITITTAKDSAMCGYNFEVGKTYLIYADGAKENLSTTNCSRTALLGKKSDAKYLDKLKRKRKLKVEKL